MIDISHRIADYGQPAVSAEVLPDVPIRPDGTRPAEETGEPDEAKVEAASDAYKEEQDVDGEGDFEEEEEEEEGEEEEEQDEDDEDSELSVDFDATPFDHECKVEVTERAREYPKSLLAADRDQ